MKRDKLFWILYGVLLALLLTAEGFAAAVIWRMNMLPGKYMALLVAVLLVLWLTVGALLLPGKKKKGAGTARQVVAVVLAVAIVVGSAVAAGVATDVHETMQAITKPMVVSATISVYVRNDDPAQGVLDAAGYTFGITGSFDAERTEQALDTIEQELGQQLSIRSFDSVFAMIDGLYAKQVGAIVINSAYVQILEDSEVYASFTQKARVLHQVDIMQEVEIPTPPPAVGNNDEPGATGGTNADNQTPGTDYNITNTPFIIYIGGSDTRSTTLASASRNDVNILAVVNPETKQLLLINTPRDYFVPNPAAGGALDKLTHCGIYGIDCSVKALADLYDVPIQYYGQINFTGFEKLVDAVGGVTVYSDVAFTARNTRVKVGENHFNGKQALEFARERKALVGGDNDRGKNQMKIIKAVVQEMASGAIISRYAQILDGLQGMFNTNISVDEISMLVKMQLSDMASWNIQTYAVSGKGGSEIPCSMPGQYAYVTYPDMATVEYAAELIEQVFAGQTLTQEDMRKN